MKENEIRQKTININLRESTAPIDLTKYPKITVPESSIDVDKFSAKKAESTEQEGSECDS